MLSKWRRRFDQRSAVVAVDFTLLLPRGMNGGIRPSVFALLERVGRLQPQIRWVFLTNTWTHAEINYLRRPGDRAVCISALGGYAQPAGGIATGDELRLDPPTGLLRTLGANVLYCPICEELRPDEDLPVVVLHADLLHRDFPDTLTPEQVARRERFFAQNVARATAIQTISRFSLARLVECYPAAAGKAFVTKLALKPSVSEEASQTVRDWAREPYFVYPANFWRHKNHYMLIEAFAAYRRGDAGGKWRLALTGHKSHEYLGVSEAIRALGVGEWVRHWEYLTATDYYSLLAGAGALLFPSLYEGFGIPLLEAMALGVPVVTSGSGSTREVCGDAALYVDPLTPAGWTRVMQQLSASSNQRLELAARVRRQAASFDLNVEASQFATVLLDLAQGIRK